MSLPYYKRFPRDFLEGTIGLSFEVKGAYSIVLDLIYMRDGSLPDDARYIAGQLGCSVRKWSAILSELVSAGKLQVANGIISNFRADYLTEETRKYRDKQAEIASVPRKNNDLQQPELSQAEAEPEPEDKRAADALRANGCEDDWPEGKSIDHARMLCDAVSNSGTLDTAREPGLIQSLGLLHRWRTRGASWEVDVLPVVMAVAGRRNGTIRNWSYFDDAVAKATEARLAPLKEGTTHGNANRPGRSGREADIDAMLEGARQAVDRRHAELSGCG